MIRTALVLMLLNLPISLIAAPDSAGEEASFQSSLDVAQQLLSDVEHSPSANLNVLRTKLTEARRITEVALKSDPDNQDAQQLQGQINELFTELAPKPRKSHPCVEEAWSTLDRLIALMKGGAPFGEIESIRTHLEQLVTKLEAEKPEDAQHIRRQMEHLQGLNRSYP